MNRNWQDSLIMIEFVAVFNSAFRIVEIPGSACIFLKMIALLSR